MAITEIAQPAVTWVLILKKETAQAKSRLSGVLAENERLALVESLFQHVLGESLRAEGIGRIAVISPHKPDAPDHVLWIKDTWCDMNQCIRHGLQEAAANGASRVLVLPCDLPHLSYSDINALLSGNDREQLVIAPDENDEGTNALLVKLPLDFDPRFGIGSFGKHMEQARRLNLKTRVVRRPGIAFDLDDQQDWARYCATGRNADAALMR